MTQEQATAARIIAENEAIIAQLRRQNEALAMMLPKVRRKDPGFITNPITGETAVYDANKTKPSGRKARRRAASRP